MTVVGKSGRKRRAVIKGISLRIRPRLHRLFEDGVFLPEGENFFLLTGERDVRSYGFKRLFRWGGHLDKLAKKGGEGKGSERHNVNNLTNFSRNNQS